MYLVKQEGPDYLKGSRFDETSAGVFKPDTVNLDNVRQKLEAMKEIEPDKASELTDQLNLLVERRRQAQENLTEVERELAGFAESLGQ